MHLPQQRVYSLPDQSSMMELKRDLKLLMNDTFIDISSDQASEVANNIMGQLRTAYDNILTAENNVSIRAGALENAREALESTRIDDIHFFRRYSAEENNLKSLNNRITGLSERISNLIKSTTNPSPEHLASDLSQLVVVDYHFENNSHCAVTNLKESVRENHYRDESKDSEDYEIV